MKIVMQKRSGALYPSDETSQSYFNKIASCKNIFVRIQTPRNIKHHRKLFALLKLVVDNTECFESTKVLLNYIKLNIGYCEIHKIKIPNLDIDTYIQYPKSMDFSTMKQEDFNIFYDKAVDFIIKNIIQNITKEEIEKQILEGF